MSGSSYFDTVTIEDFKTYFSIRRAFTFNTTPLWDSQVPYEISFKVHSNTFEIYTSLIANNTQPLTDNTAWELQVDSLTVFDEFIQEGFNESKSKMSYWINDLPDTDSRKKQAYLLLSAHCLQLLLQQRDGIESTNAYTSGGFLASESANGVSLSYARPNSFTEATAWLTSTSFGIEYNAINKQVYIPAPFTVNPYNLFSN
jgi:hypothetical protein